VSHVEFQESYKDVYPGVIDAIMLYLSRHPRVSEKVHLPFKAAHPTRLLVRTDRGSRTKKQLIPEKKCYKPSWDNKNCGEEHFSAAPGGWQPPPPPPPPPKKEASSGSSNSTKVQPAPPPPPGPKGGPVLARRHAAMEYDTWPGEFLN
jgi:hypothetical protein